MRSDQAMPVAFAPRRAEMSLFRFVPATILLGALAFSSQLAAAPPAGDSRSYKLAPGDQIAVMVFNQPQLTADAVIDGGGFIILPFLDPLEVKDLTILECQTLIRDRLADGILKHPSVSVRIVELRPIYISGDVRTPGAYPFRPGSTVQGVVAVAGGYGPTDQIQNANVSDFLVADERLRQLTLQKKTLLVRQARLGAQLAGASTFSPPADLDAAASPDLARIVAAERETFDTQTALLRGQLDLLRSQKPRLQKEIEALQEQITTETKQLQLIKEQIDRYDRLVKQGLGTQTANFQLTVIEANQESSIWRLKAGLSRLQMDAGELDLKIEEAEASLKRQVATDLREVRDRLSELDVTLPAARELREVKLQYMGAFAASGAAHSISITRVVNGQISIFEATAATALEPGDVVEVVRLFPSRPSRSIVSQQQTGPQNSQDAAMQAAAAAGHDGP